MSEPTEYIDENLPMVQVILLMRIYDLLWVTLATQDPDTASKIAEVHESGQFVGPNPSIAGPSDSDV
jgi:hypothetical protein